jgi:hypothetical protein
VLFSFASNARRKRNPVDDFIKVLKVETPIHDNDLILTPIIAPQSG